MGSGDSPELAGTSFCHLPVPAGLEELPELPGQASFLIPRLSWILMDQAAPCIPVGLAASFSPKGAPPLLNWGPDLVRGLARAPQTRLELLKGLWVRIVRGFCAQLDFPSFPEPLSGWDGSKGLWVRNVRGFFAQLDFPLVPCPIWL